MREATQDGGAAGLRVPGARRDVGWGWGRGVLSSQVCPSAPRRPLARVQIRDLTAKNAELNAQLRDAESELTELREVAEAAAELQAQDVQAGRVIELSKKARPGSTGTAWHDACFCMRHRA